MLVKNLRDAQEHLGQEVQRKAKDIEAMQTVLDAVRGELRTAQLALESQSTLASVSRNGAIRLLRRRAKDDQ